MACMHKLCAKENHGMSPGCSKLNFAGIWPTVPCGTKTVSCGTISVPYGTRLIVPKNLPLAADFWSFLLAFHHFNARPRDLKSHCEAPFEETYHF